jgi:hypothetical protein
MGSWATIKLTGTAHCSASQSQVDSVFTLKLVSVLVV